MRNNKTLFDKFTKFIDKYPREYIVLGFFIVFSFIIIWKVFSYTVLNYDFYKGLADNQQIWEVKIPVTRWNIYSKNDTVFATSVNLNDLAIDPQMPWDIGKLTVFLRDVIYKEVCLTRSEDECYDWMLKLLKLLEIEDFIYEEKYLKELILDWVKEKISQKKVTSVLLETDISPRDIETIKTFFLNWVYLNEWNIYINPEEITNKEGVAEKLSQIISIPKPRIEYLIRKRDKRYISILNKLSISTSEEIVKYIEEETEAIKRWILDEEKGLSSFIILTPYPQRYYPEKTIASQITWFLDNEGVWHYWLEGHFNDILKWNAGYIISRKDIQGRTIDPISLKLWDSLWEGARIYSTIDRNVQKKVENILEAWVKFYRANKGSIVVMDPKTWSIISMANYPSYDANNPWNVYELEKVKYSKYPDPIIDLKWYPVFVVDSNEWKEFFYNWKKILLRGATEDELWNIAVIKYKYKNDFWPSVYKNDVISSMYEPGSIMKAITVAIWLDSWEINKYSMYTDKWEVTIDQFHIKNVSDKCLGYNSFAHALNYSCNVWMLRIAQRYGKAIAYEYFNKFGFSKKTGINLDGETYREIDNFEKWSVAKLLTSSYWLGISVTPLQMATAYSVLANWWLYIKPHIVDSIKFPDGKILEYKTEVQHRVVKESTSKTMISMLVDSVNNWVASNAQVEWYSIAWKTWTSQIASKWWYEEWVASTFASFAWFAPAEDPKFVIVVKLDRPRVSEYWGATSAKIFKEVSEYLLDYYKVPRRK